MPLKEFFRRRREEKARARDVPKLPDPKQPESIEDRVQAIYDRFVTRTQADVTGLWEMLGSRRKLLWVNFLAGMSRGVGFFLGVTLIGGLVIGGTAFVLDKAAETMGWKDITFARMVEGVYGKFKEVQRVITDMEDVEDDGVADGGTDVGAAAFGYASPAYFDRSADTAYMSTVPPGGPPPEAALPSLAGDDEDG